MNEMIERVGDAIMDDLSDRSGVFDGIDADTLEEIRLAVGRAAIEAMREPTEDMEKAGHSAGERFGQFICHLPFPRATYQAMLDAALKDYS